MEPTLGVNVDPNDAATQELVSKYAKAEAEVAVALQSAVPVLPDGTATQNRNVNRQFRRSQQRNTEAFLDRIRGQLDDDTAEWVRRVIPHTYISGASKVALATDSDTQVSWNLLHRQAATLLAADTQADLAAATAHMTEGAKDFIRYAAKREVLDQVLTGRAATIGRQLAKRLEQQGLSGFVDASGRSWRLSTYAEMVVRTKRQAAQNTGASIRMQQQGVTACYIIDGTRDDEDCRTINGRTCSVAWSLNHPLEHPNCTRTFGPLPNYDGPLDYGTYDDTIDLDKLGKEPDEQLLYGDPPTQRPARNPVRAGQLPKPEPSLPPAPPVEVVDVIGAATVAEYRAVANQLGFDEDPLEWVPDNDLVKMANAWDDLDDNAKRLAIRQEMQKLGLTPKAVVGEVTEDALAAAKSAAPQWAQDAVQTFQGKGYNLTADQVVDLLDDSPLSSTLSLVQQQLATGGPAADVFESFLQSKGVAKVVADIDIPGGGPGDVMNPLQYMSWDKDLEQGMQWLSQAINAQNEGFIDDALGYVEQVRLATMARIEALGALERYDEADALLKQLSQLAKPLETLKPEAQAVKKALAKQTAAQIKADAGDDLSKMAGKTYTPGESVLWDAARERPMRADAKPAVKRHADAWAKRLSYDERAAVRTYTGSEYRVINEALRAGRRPTRYGKVVDDIDSALDKAGDLPEPTAVWRGVRFREVGGMDWQQRADWAEDTYRVGSEVRWDAYTSTSTSPTVAADSFGGGGIVFEVEARRGVFIKEVSGIKGEDELLLPRGSRFEVVAVHRSVPFSGGGYRTVVQLRQIG